MTTSLRGSPCACSSSLSYVAMSAWRLEWSFQARTHCSSAQPVKQLASSPRAQPRLRVWFKEAPLLSPPCCTLIPWSGFFLECFLHTRDFWNTGSLLLRTLCPKIAVCLTHLHTSSCRFSNVTYFKCHSILISLYKSIISTLLTILFCTFIALIST